MSDSEESARDSDNEVFIDIQLLSHLLNKIIIN